MVKTEGRRGDFYNRHGKTEVLLPCSSCPTGRSKQVRTALVLKGGARRAEG